MIKLQLQLTEEQAVTVHAALVVTSALCRKHEGHFLDLHESPEVGPVTRAETWRAFQKWLRHESEIAVVMQQIQNQVSLDFSAWQLFDI